MNEITLNEFKEIFNRIIEVLEDYVADNVSKVLLEGEDKILNNPEYNNTQKVKRLEKSLIITILIALIYIHKNIPEFKLLIKK